MPPGGHVILAEMEHPLSLHSPYSREEPSGSSDEGKFDEGKFSDGAGTDVDHPSAPLPAAARGSERGRVTRRTLLLAAGAIGLGIAGAEIEDRVITRPARRPVARRPVRRSVAPRVTPAALPASPDDFSFSGYFHGPAGSLPDAAQWTWNTGPGAQVGGNAETETYVQSPANSRLDGDGHLVIAVTPDGSGGFDSARLLSNFSQRFGHWQARIAAPDIAGCHPAFWFLGKGLWPGCGEADVMENYGTGFMQQTIWNSTATVNHNNAVPWDSGFHVYQLDWEEELIRVFYDGELRVTATPETLTPWPFGHNGGMHCLLNIATGGTATGGINPDPALLPAKMIVDYVRCWK